MFFIVFGNVTESLKYVLFVKINRTLDDEKLDQMRSDFESLVTKKKTSQQKRVVASPKKRALARQTYKKPKTQVHEVFSSSDEDMSSFIDDEPQGTAAVIL